jgi:hypothetical protein
MRDFKELFSGYEYAYGKYDVSNATKRARDGKAEGKAVTVTAATPPEAWENHRAGVIGLGMIPLKADNTISFFAIDIDIYEDVRDEKGVAFVKEHSWEHLPLVFCRSKSGGLHAYGFLAEPVEAADYRNSTLQWVAAALGYPNAEIFPKQIMRTNPYVDAGNWINLPYFGETRRAVSPKTGQELDFDSFIAFANERLITADMLDAFVKPKRAQRTSDGKAFNPDDYESADATFGDGPPCLQTLIERYEDDGATPERNNFLFNVGVYGFRKYGSTEGAIEAIRETNAQFKAPLTDSELAESLCSRDGDKYADAKYGCKKSPIQAACDAKLCQRRAFGVAWPTPKKKGGADFIENVRVLKYQTPITLIDIKGTSVDFVGGDELLSLQKFRSRVYDATYFVVPITNQNEFVEIMKALTDRAEKIEVEDPLQTGNVLSDILTSYIAQRESGDADNSDIAGGAVVVQPDGKHLINLNNFIGFMKAQHNTVIEPRRLMRIMTDKYQMKTINVPLPGKKFIQGALLEFVAGE